MGTWGRAYLLLVGMVGGFATSVAENPGNTFIFPEGIVPPSGAAGLKITAPTLKKTEIPVKTTKRNSYSIITPPSGGHGESRFDGRTLFPEPSKSELCSDPYKAICNRADEKRHKIVLDTDQRATLFETTRRQFVTSPVDAKKLAAQDNGEWSRYLASLFQQQRQVEERVLDEFTSVRKSLIHRIRKATDIPRQTADQMVQRIGTARMTSIAERVLSGKETILNFQVSCGIDGLSNGAYYVRASNELFLCPVLFLDKNADLEYTFTHELGHSIDSGQFPDVYSRLLACYRRDEFSKFEQGSAKTELTADFVAIESFIDRNIGSDTSADQALDSAAQFLGRYCLPGGKPSTELPKAVKDAVEQRFRPSGARVHASNNFRLGVMLARVPEFRKALGCPERSAENPTCGRQGIIR